MATLGAISGAAIVLTEWPVDQFAGSSYRLVTDQDADAAVRATSWWYIAVLHHATHPDATGIDQQAAADHVIPMRDTARSMLSTSSGEVISDERILGVISDERILGVITNLLTGREPRIEEGIHLIPCSYLLISMLDHLIDDANRQPPTKREAPRSDRPREIDLTLPPPPERPK